MILIIATCENFRPVLPVAFIGKIFILLRVIKFCLKWVNCLDVIVDTYSTIPFYNYQTLYHELTYEAVFKSKELSFVI